MNTNDICSSYQITKVYIKIIFFGFFDEKISLVFMSVFRYHDLPIFIWDNVEIYFLIDGLSI